MYLFINCFSVIFEELLDEKGVIDDSGSDEVMVGKWKKPKLMKKKRK